MSGLPFNAFLNTISGQTAEEAVRAILYTLQWLSRGSYKGRNDLGDWNDQLGFYTEELDAYAANVPSAHVMQVLRSFVKDPELVTGYN